MQTTNKEEAFETERHLISEFKTNIREYGYNISDGGECGALGVHWSDERRKAYSEKYRGEKHPRYGIKHSEETLEKLKAARALRGTPQESIDSLLEYVEKTKEPVVCVETNEVFSSISDAARAYGVPTGSISVACSLFPKRTSGGLHWHKISDCFDQVDTDLLIKYKRNRLKAVLCIETGIEYESVSEAARVNELDPRHISRCCRQSSRTAGGYHWKYVKPNDEVTLYVD